MALRFAPFAFRVAALALVIYGIAVLQLVREKRLPVSDSIYAVLAIVGAAGLLYLHLFARRVGRPNFTTGDIWRARSLGGLAYVGAFVLPLIPIGILEANGFFKGDNSIGGFVVVFAALALAWWLFETMRDAGRTKIALAYSLAMPAAESVLRLDPRRPILYLRPFSEDHAWLDVQSLDLVAPIFRGTVASGPDGAFEDSLIEPLWTLGPVVTIANPGELPVSGAARFYAGDNEWQGKVKGWVLRAELILIVLGTSAGLAWELDQIVASNLLHKTVFLLPAKIKLDEVWRLLEGKLVGTPWKTAIAEIKGPEVRLFYLGRSHNAVRFSCTKATDLAYGLGIQLAIYGLKVHDKTLMV